MYLNNFVLCFLLVKYVRGFDLPENLVAPLFISRECYDKLLENKAYVNVLNAPKNLTKYVIHSGDVKKGLSQDFHGYEPISLRKLESEQYILNITFYKGPDVCKTETIAAIIPEKSDGSECITAKSINLDLKNSCSEYKMGEYAKDYSKNIDEEDDNLYYYIGGGVLLLIILLIIIIIWITKKKRRQKLKTKNNRPDILENDRVLYADLDLTSLPQGHRPIMVEESPYAEIINPNSVRFTQSSLYQNGSNSSFNEESPYAEVVLRS
ncbi:uncharacterized protein LOC142984824 isoform X2 [Anticarsia gemmatalis]|uniref:uncharacterized protein LOC142984824 isoform X2 n=1 Tax=Anticarsia gemmatalis TaxID=129554 RepID=UPI003F777F3C